jgi:hypothetical protein
VDLEAEILAEEGVGLCREARRTPRRIHGLVRGGGDAGEVEAEQSRGEALRIGSGWKSVRGKDGGDFNFTRFIYPRRDGGCPLARAKAVKQSVKSRSEIQNLSICGAFRF